MNRIGVQLYTVRPLLNTEDQMQDTLQKIKAIGYDSVQLCGDFAFAQCCARHAADAGLDITSVHSSLDVYREYLPQYIELCQQYGIEELAVSNLRNEPDEVPDFIASVNTIAGIFRKNGLLFSYHNHATEFIKDSSGKTAMQHYLKEFDPESVLFMPDTFWLQFGGIDIRHFLEITKGRVNTIHLKDLVYTRKGADFAAIGQGNLYFDGILDTALQMGIRHYIVEQDVCPTDPLECLRQSYEYIRSLNRL